jgi:hypothetical protein
MLPTSHPLILLLQAAIQAVIQAVIIQAVIISPTFNITNPNQTKYIILETLNR